MNTPNNDRDVILESVRAEFEAALRSDDRPLEDLLQWAPGLLLTTDFTRALNLIAEAFVGNPGVVRKVVPLRATPSPRSWRETPTASLWRVTPSADAEPTTWQTDEYEFYSEVLTIIRARITDSDDVARLAQFERHTRTLAPREGGAIYNGRLEHAVDPQTMEPPSTQPSSRPTANLSFSHVRQLPGRQRRFRLTLTVTTKNREVLAEYQATI